MNFISSVLIICAILLSGLTFLALIGWLLKGGTSIIFPGLGLIITTPDLIVLLLIFQINLVILAGFIKPSKTDSTISESQTFAGEKLE